MKALALGLLAVMMQVCAAPQEPYRSNMTGTQLTRDMLADPFANPLNSVRRERAMGYLDGVMDAAVGLRWCPNGTAVPHELNYVVTEEMARLGPEKLKGGAAPLVLDTLARLYPCKPPGAQP